MSADTWELLERDFDEFSSQPTTRSIPVTDSKYLPVWQRVRAKLKAEIMVNNLKQDI